LSDEDLLLHLALHCSYHHGFDRSALKGLIDVDNVVARCRASLDWTVLAERANGWGVGRFLYATLRVAEELLGTTVPSSVLDRLHHSQADEDIVETALSYTLAPVTDLPDPYVQLAETKGIKGRTKILWRHAFLPRESMEKAYGLRPGSPTVYGYYFLRLLDLAARRGRTLLRALVRSREVQPALEWAGRRHRIQAWVEDRPNGSPAKS
jgi:hypothetical protein